MSDILVFSPPVPDELCTFSIGGELPRVCGWLLEEGYDFDQRSLLAEVRYLNRFRFQSDIVDLSVFDPESVVRYLKGDHDRDIERETRKLADILNIEDYDVIIVPAPSELIYSQRDFRLMWALPILKEATSEEQTVIIGGIDLTDEMQILDFPFVDYVIDGDMEIPLTNILEHEIGNNELEIDPGVVCKREGKILEGDPYKHPVNMKAKPYFNTELLKKYEKTMALNKRIISYRLGEGCSQDCNFCNLFENQKYDYKDLDKVVRELKELKEEHGTDKFWFTDRNLFNDPDYLKELSLRIIEEDLDIKWAGLSVVVPRDQEFFDILSESGCKALQHGIESASNSVLHRMQKHQTGDMLEKTLEKESKAGIKIYGLFLTDYVDESWEEYFETVDFIRNNKHMTGGRIASLMVFPDENQPLYRKPDEYGVELENVEDQNWLEKSFDYSINFTDSRDESLESQKRRRKLKENHMEKIIDYHAFFKNYGKKYPISFARLQINKILKKDYPDNSHYFV